ncbi:MAG: YhgE/Pip domain-containing protein, partial [Clostridiales bacterium]|nr:YhgE/Pip domain-containing protein [Clostridiales bacterium]
FKIFISDAKRILKNVVAVVVIMGLSVIPSLYAWFNIFSNWDPYGPSATSNLKVAVVSADKGTEIAGISVNIGSNVVDTLKSNDTIGWVFTDTVDEAVNGVYDNSYYAALVIPEEFTEEMISFLGGEIENPDIIYYENEKKNAIAPKITAKAKTTVQEQVNAAFVSTLAEVMMKVTGTIAGADVEGTTVENAVLDRLNGLSEDLHGYISILNSFVSIMGSAQSIVETSQVMLPGLDTMVSTGQDTVNSMEGLLVAGDATADSVTQMVNYSFDMISNTLDSVSTLVQNDMNTLKNYEEAVGKGLTGSQSMMPYLRKLFDNAVGGWEDTADDETQTQIQNIRDQMNVIELELEGLTENGVATAEDINRLETQITGQLQACKQSVADLKDYYTYTVKPNLDDTMNKMHTSMVTTTSILNGIDADFSDVEYVLRDYQKTLEQGSASLQDSLAMAQNLYNGLTEVIADFVELQQDEQYQEIMKIVESDPELLGNFISSPVNLDTVGIYEIENYGSAMAPFYTILALWVGALILVAIIHVKVEPVEEIGEIKPYQAYFGRYITFFLVGQVQTLITVLGDLFYVRIQCHNPFLFWLAAAVSSFVFTLFIYSLTVAFGNVGEALAIVVMVIQVAGAGGTFPIQTLPQIYQTIYKYLPFPYGMDAMRETIGGIYQLDYWKDIGILGIYLVISLFIGLVVAIPFRKLMHMIEKSKENTGIMI